MFIGTVLSIGDAVVGKKEPTLETVNSKQIKMLGGDNSCEENKKTMR